MTTGKNSSVEKYLWILSVSFITYLFLGSFIISRNISDLIYLILLYAVITLVKISNKNK